MTGEVGVVLEGSERKESETQFVSDINQQVAGPTARTVLVPWEVSKILAGVLLQQQG